MQWGGGKRLHAATVPIAAVFTAAAAALHFCFASPDIPVEYFVPSLTGATCLPQHDLLPLHHLLQSFGLIRFSLLIQSASFFWFNVNPGTVIALLLLTASFYADAVCVSRVSRAAHGFSSSCTAAALAFVVNHAALTSSATDTASSIVPQWAMVCLCSAGVLLGVFAVRPDAGGTSGGKQLPMFAMSTGASDGYATDDDHAKQVTAKFCSTTHDVCSLAAAAPRRHERPRCSPRVL
jgi:putative effector of murein hydrolase LrgA (UPF0299 family)